jgi:hypothetical protein
MAARDVAACNTHAEAAKALSVLRAAQPRPTWRNLAGIIGVNAGTLVAVAKGRRPAPPPLLVALGLQAPGRTVIVAGDQGVGRLCAACGVVHDNGPCPAKRKRVRRSRSMRGAVLLVSASAKCRVCGAMTVNVGGSADKVGRKFWLQGWTFDSRGPVCGECNAKR